MQHLDKSKPGSRVADKTGQTVAMPYMWYSFTLFMNLLSSLFESIVGNSIYPNAMPAGYRYALRYALQPYEYAITQSYFSLFSLISNCQLHFKYLTVDTYFLHAMWLLLWHCFGADLP